MKGSSSSTTSKIYRCNSSYAALWGKPNIFPKFPPLEVAGEIDRAGGIFSRVSGSYAYASDSMLVITENSTNQFIVDLNNYGNVACYELQIGHYAPGKYLFGCVVTGKNNMKYTNGDARVKFGIGTSGSTYTGEGNNLPNISQKYWNFPYGNDNQTYDSIDRLVTISTEQDVSFYIAMVHCMHMEISGVYLLKVD